MSTCTRWQTLLVDYVDDHLNDVDRHSLDAHLATCEACRARLAEERWLSDRLRQAADESPIERLLVWPPRPAAPRPRTGRRRVLVGAGLAALAAIVIGRLPFAVTRTVSPPAVADRVASSEDRRFAEIEAAIEGEACAAQLAMSAEILATEPAAERYAAEAMSLVAEAFPETKAGRDAARRAGSSLQGAVESL
jgi:predicted anti-sigma-YlaC factor YlaD